MSKKVKILVSVVAAVVLLTVGGTAIVMAQDEPAQEEPVQEEPSANGLLDRVAEILGIEKEDLVNAFKQAQQEMRDEVVDRLLAKALEKGLLTEDEANEIEEWWAQKPEVLGSGLFPHALGTRGLRGRHMSGGLRGWCWSTSPEPAD